MKKKKTNPLCSRTQLEINTFSVKLLKVKMLFHALDAKVG